MDLHGSVDCTDRIVLVGTGDTKERKTPVTHHPLDEALVLGHDLFDPGEDAAGDLLDLLGVELFGHGRVAGEIREEGCDVFAFRFGRGDGVLTQVG